MQGRGKNQYPSQISQIDELTKKLNNEAIKCYKLSFIFYIQKTYYWAYN